MLDSECCKVRDSLFGDHGMWAEVPKEYRPYYEALILEFERDCPKIGRVERIANALYYTERHIYANKSWIGRLFSETPNYQKCYERVVAAARRDLHLICR